MRLLIYGMPGSPLKEIGEWISSYLDLDLYEIKLKDCEEKDYYNIPSLEFDTGDMTPGSESQHLRRDPSSSPEELGGYKILIPNVKLYLNSEELEFLNCIDNGIVCTELPDPCLSRWADKIIELRVEPKKLRDWFNKRSFCPSCKTVFHEEEKPSKYSGVCDRCGTYLIKKEFDTPSYIVKQFENWDKIFWKLKELCKKKHYFWINISLKKDMDAILFSIKNFIDKK